MERSVLPVAAARYVPDAKAGRGIPHLKARTVIENPGFVWVGDVARRSSRLDDESNRLIVGRDKNINRKPGLGWRRRWTPSGMPHGQTEKSHVDEAVRFRDHQRDGKPPGVPIEGEEPAPSDVINPEQQGCNNDGTEDKDPGHALQTFPIITLSGFWVTGRVLEYDAKRRLRNICSEVQFRLVVGVRRRLKLNRRVFGVEMILEALIKKV